MTTAAVAAAALTLHQS